MNIWDLSEKKKLTRIFGGGYNKPVCFILKDIGVNNREKSHAED